MLSTAPRPALASASSNPAGVWPAIVLVTAQESNNAGVFPAITPAILAKAA
jgi:hypothetical protein